VLIKKQIITITKKIKHEKSKDRYESRYLNSQDETFIQLYSLNLLIKIFFYSIKR